jgi:hypothetical protein
MRLLRSPSHKGRQEAWNDEGCPFVVAEIPSMDGTSYDMAFGGQGNHAFRRTARYRDESGRFVYVQTYRPGTVTTVDVKKQVLDNARRFAARQPDWTGDRQPEESRADWTTSQLVFNGRPEPFEITPVAGDLSVAVGSPGGTPCSVTAFRTPLGDIRLRPEDPRTVQPDHGLS